MTMTVSGASACVGKCTSARPKCSVSDCDNPRRTNGLCGMHAQRLRRSGTLESSHRSTCSVDGCVRKHHAKGYCHPHWMRWRKHGDPLAGRPFGTQGCSVEDCERPHRARGLCALHWARAQRTGTTESPWAETCQLPDCVRSHYGLGLCRRHYDMRREMDPDLAPREPRVPLRPLLQIIRSAPVATHQLAFDLGIEVRNFYRMLEQETVQIGTADKIALRLGHHIAWIYPEFYDMAVA